MSSTPKLHARQPDPVKSGWFLPREHGATAMLITPMVASAIVSRQWGWPELAVFLGAIAALAAKDPAVVVARQRLVWNQQRPESAAAWKWLGGYVLILLACAAILASSWQPQYLIAAVIAVSVFGALAVWVNVRNKQRSVLFQIVSAAMLTSGSLAVCLSATGTLPDWVIWLWGLSTLQSTAGILLVHSRLDARIALRNPATNTIDSKRAARGAIAVLTIAAAASAVSRHWWIAAALLLITAGYTHEFRQQSDPTALQMPLKTVGLRALALSIAFSVLVVIGLW